MTTPTTGFERFAVRKASDTQFGVCVALYGSAGVGKTTLAAGAADSEFGRPVVFLDAEGGTRAIAHRDDIDVIDIKSWKQLREFMDTAIKQGGIPWRTIVMDNMSEYLNLVKSFVTGDNDAPSQPEWGKMTMEMLRFTRDSRDLSRKIDGPNVILIAWDQEVRDEVGRAKHNLAFTPRLQTDFPGLLDIIGYMTSVERSETHERMIDFTHNPRKTQAKFRRSQSETALEIPYQIVYDLKKNPMADILDVLRGGAKWPSSKYTTKTTK